MSEQYRDRMHAESPGHVADQAAALRRAATSGATIRGPARCLTIGSGKGGVGKTVVSVGLSHALREMGLRVLLFDGDMGLANVDLQMGLDPVNTVQDVIFGDCSIADACVSALDGLDVLVSASGAPELADLSTARRHLFIEDLFRFASRYDMMVIDTGAGIGRGSVDFMAASPESLVVLTAEPTSLMDAYALIKTLHLRQAAEGLGVVVNMVDSIEQGERMFERLRAIARQFLGLELVLEGVLTFDRRVSEAIRRQQSIMRYATGGAVAQCLRDLARTVLGRPSRVARGPEFGAWVEQWEQSAFLGAGDHAGGRP